MKKALSTVVVVFASLPALAQTSSIQAELHLDARNKLGFQFPYQRYDSVHTTELRLQATLPQETKANVLVQRRYFSTRIVEASVERPVSSSTTLRAGLQRLPFGIYDWQETYRSGLIDYAMPRVDYGTSGVDQSVLGVGATVRRDRVQAEGAAFTGNGVTVWNDFTPRRGAAGRVQLFLPPDTIIGLSHVSQSQKRFSGGERWAQLSGLDLRYARPYLVLRGEVIQGTLGGRRYDGAYLDSYYRLPGLPAWTLTARTEALKPTPTAPRIHQLTLGARWTLTPEWSATVNWRQNNLTPTNTYPGTWIAPAGKRGAVIVQLYRIIALGS